MDFIDTHVICGFLSIVHESPFELLHSSTFDLGSQVGSERDDFQIDRETTAHHCFSSIRGLLKAEDVPAFI